ncbi:hypothetical protein RvY_14147 [Ramazzottius varieornatus]|uniref:BED-type domain-containing protein n=1 Tax=Ramazzottius varieornatus TaxID=947166 RepID=A0A1D1VQB3_RAMVA|nr:hypothetical protein RvY_14147 [Ramazzottius varieornatus]
MEDIAEEEEIDLTSAGIPQKRKKHNVTGKPKAVKRTIRSTELTREEVVKGIGDGVYDRKANDGGRSEIWRAFSKVETSDTKEELDFVSCNKCHHVYSHKVNSGTTALANHVVSCKGKSGGPMDGYVRTVDGISRKTRRSFRMLSLTKRHKGVLEAKDIMPTAKTVSSHVTSQVRALREKDGPRVKDILLNRGGCITLDGWTEDYAKTKHMGFKLHYIEDYVLKKQLLSISEHDCSKSQEAEEIREFVVKKLSEFSLSEEDCKKVTFVSDAAPNMMKTFNLNNRALMKRISCACHMLNTCLANAVNRRPNSQSKLSDDGLPVLKLFQQCKELVTYCKQAYLFRELSAAPKQSVDTRWNSSLDMRDSIIRLYEESGDLLQARDEKDKLPGPLGFLQAVADLSPPFKKP